MKDFVSPIELYPKEGPCCLCGKPYYNGGYDPHPLLEKKNTRARCCEECYALRVSKAKMLMPECPNKK